MKKFLSLILVSVFLSSCAPTQKSFSSSIPDKPNKKTFMESVNDLDKWLRDHAW